MSLENLPLKVGAGRSEIVFPEAMFPMEEGFVSIHDNPHARVMLMERGDQVAVVSLELIICPKDCVDEIKRIISEKTGTPQENVWVHVTHVFCTPHAPRDPENRALFCDAVVTAVTAATNQAAETLREAKIGVGTGKTSVIANCNVKTKDGYMAGLNGEGPSDPALTVLRAESLDGTVIGLLFACAAKSYCADVSRGTGGREITSDFTGYAAATLEKEIGAPALFFMTAAGDQHPVKAAMDVAVKDDGTYETIDLGVREGLKIAEELGAVFAGEVIAVASSVICDKLDVKVICTGSTYTWATRDGGEAEIAVEAMRIGDTAFIGVMQEINCATALELKEASPFENTVLMTFVNGDRYYMPDAKAYEINTVETKRTGLIAGGAERLVAVSVELLEGMKK